jgi:16S rRNA (uracil1498-N3)-methyltransferase
MVELGVWSINLIESKYSVAKPDKIDNMKKDVIAACKQSTNPFAADVKEAQSFKQAVEQCQWPIIFGGIPTNNNTTSSQQDEEVALFIGPEGGFSQEEITLLLQKNAESIAIGRYILRTETAAVALLAILNK